MPTLTTLNAVKKGLMRGVFAAALIALIGLQATGAAAQGQHLWSIVVHFQYQDGFEFDYVLERGVPTAAIGAFLAECGPQDIQ